MTRPVTGQVSLLRGINVGGNVLVPMARLRPLYEALGLADVRTHLQSGNVVFRSDRPPEETSAAAEAALQAEFGRSIRVMGRTHQELAAVIAAGPFHDAEPSHNVVLFLLDEPPPSAVERIQAAAKFGEEIRGGARELYINYPAGQARTSLTGPLLERAVGVGTARNWRTVTKLLELTADESRPG